MTDGLPDSEYLSGRDNAWRRMGDRTNHMIITAVLFFEEPVTYEELEEKLGERLLAFKRFRQRVVAPWHRLRPKWKSDPLFDIDTHLTHVALPEPQGKKELQRFVAEKMDKDLDRSKALWQGWLVEGAGEGDGNALVVRLHHALGDGFALLYVLLGLADDPASIDMPLGDVPPPPDVSEKEWQRMSVDAPEPDGTEDGEDGIDEELYGSEGEKEDEGQEGTDVENEKEGSSVGEMVSMGANMAKIGYNSLTLSKEPKTSLRGDLELTERISWTKDFDTERVQEVGHAYDSTINDVLMAATAGGFRRYLVENGEEVPEDLDLRCAVPVNLKPLEERTEELGNYFGLGFLRLPVGIEDPQERMEMIQDRTGRLKQGTEAFLMYLSLSIVGVLPRFAQDLVLRRFHNRMTAAVTNVPGPKEAIEFAGSKVSDIKFWVPRSEDIGVGVSIFSYDGSVSVGVAVDESLVSEPERLADAFDREMEAILGTVEAEQKESEGVGETENESEGVREEGEEGVQTADADGD
jgi:WS/DGAT/MGAT family acyltransferase